MSLKDALGGGFLGDLIGGGLDFLSQSKLAGDNREWQAMMAKNAVQFRVQDMIKAGINPILAAGSVGGGMGAPSGGVGSGTSLSSAGSRSVQSAAQAKLADKQMLLLDSEINQKNAAAERDRASAAREAVEAAYTSGARTAEALSRAEEAGASAAEKRANIGRINAEVNRIGFEIQDILASVDLKGAEAWAARMRGLLDGVDAETQRRIMESVVSKYRSQAESERAGVFGAKQDERAKRSHEFWNEYVRPILDTFNLGMFFGLNPRGGKGDGGAEDAPDFRRKNRRTR